MENNLPTKIDAISQAIDKANSIPELKHIHDQVDAMRPIIKQLIKEQRINFDSLYNWAVKKLDAERKAGSMLFSITKQPGTRTDLTFAPSAKVVYSKLLDELNLHHRTSEHWQIESELPDNLYRQLLIDLHAKELEPTSATLQKHTKDWQWKQLKKGLQKEYGDKALAFNSDTIQIIIGDFRDHIEKDLGSIISNTIDHVITDPPYAAKYLPLWGDLANAREKAYGSLKEMADKLEIPYDSLVLYQWVAQQYEVMTRVITLSFKHHRIAAPLEDRLEWLKKAGKEGWKKETYEIAVELYLAREILSNEGRPWWKITGQDCPVKKTWNDYCKDAGLPKRTANHWLMSVFGPKRIARPLPPKIESQVIYADPPWQYDFSETDSRAIENPQNHPQQPLVVVDQRERPSTAFMHGAMHKQFHNYIVVGSIAPANRSMRIRELAQVRGAHYRC